MNIDEAIEMLQFFYDQRVTHLADSELNAVKLGIEALKVVKDAKIVGHYGRLYSLPGETEE